jgi:hypothetical protein
VRPRFFQVAVALDPETQPGQGEKDGPQGEAVAFGYQRHLQTFTQILRLINELFFLKMKTQHVV